MLLNIFIYAYNNNYCPGVTQVQLSTSSTGASSDYKYRFKFIIFETSDKMHYLLKRQLHSVNCLTYTY